MTVKDLVKVYRAENIELVSRVNTRVSFPVSRFPGILVFFNILIYPAFFHFPENPGI